MVAAGLLPGVDIKSFLGALGVAVIVAALNAVIPPLLAALRLPLTLVLGFLLVLIADALILLLADALTDGILEVDNFGWALLAALVVAAVSVVLAVFLGSDDTSSIRIASRIARRQGIIASTDVPGIVYLEIDGLALPVLRRAMRDGNAPTMARWLAEGSHRLAEWETDLSSQTGASQAGILLGSNEDISAFRWVEKETATLMTCSAPPDCAELERRLGTGIGLLTDGGASRGNLLSGEADAVILTVSRMDEEKKSNPGYRAFFANGDNVTRTLVLFVWEVFLEWTAALRAIRRDVRPRGHRGGIYPADARGALRLRPRSDRVRRPHRHDARAARRLRDLLELRRGGAPLGARARGHARGAAQARRPLRPHRARTSLRAAAVRDRRPLRPRADAGCDLQAAQRLRPRRPGRTLARPGQSHGDRRRGRAERDGRQRRHRRNREEGEEAEERRLRPRRRRARLGQSRPDLSDGGAPPADARGDRRATSRPDPRASLPSPCRLAAGPLLRAGSGRDRRQRHQLPRRGRCRRGGSARALLSDRRRSTCCAPTASSMSATSWSAASTTPSSRRAARSRS